MEIWSGFFFAFHTCAKMPSSFVNKRGYLSEIFKLMSKLRNIITLLCLTLYIGAFAQETRIYADPVSRYNNGLELYDKEKFAAAITEFSAYLEQAVEAELRINA